MKKLVVFLALLILACSPSTSDDKANVISLSASVTNCYRDNDFLVCQVTVSNNSSKTLGYCEVSVLGLSSDSSILFSYSRPFTGIYSAGFKTKRFSIGHVPEASRYHTSFSSVRFE